MLYNGPWNILTLAEGYFFANYNPETSNNARFSCFMSNNDLAGSVNDITSNIHRDYTSAFVLPSIGVAIWQEYNHMNVDTEDILDIGNVFRKSIIHFNENWPHGVSDAIYWWKCAGLFSESWLLLHIKKVDGNYYGYELHPHGITTRALYQFLTGDAVDTFNNYDDEYGGEAMPSGPSFGVELEVILPFYTETDVLTDKLHNKRIPTRDIGYTHERTPYWKLVGDSSLSDGGIELVSPVLNHDTAIEKLEVVASALREAKAHVDETCGYHIHHNASYMNVRQAASIALAYTRARDIFDSILPYSRRETSYCEHFNSDEIEQIEEYMEDYPDHKARSLAGLIGDRYRTVNLESLSNHGTIEFRHHSGTINPNKIINWYKLTTRMVEIAVANQSFPTPGKNINEATIRKYMYDLQVGDEVEDFYAMRYNTLLRRERNEKSSWW